MRSADHERASSKAERPGAFVLSLDFELIWGTLDLFGPQRFQEACRIERERVIAELLSLLEEYEVPATWCVLGHLFLECCSRDGGRAHPEIVPPRHSWVRREWFANDPCSNERSAPLYYARSLVERIRGCRVAQEIGAHSFSHAIFSDAGCSTETAASELRACVEAAARIGVTPCAFAFPRNGIGHLERLVEHGFTCFRGPANRWYERRDPPRDYVRLARLLSVLTAATPPTTAPRRTACGIVDVPASMMYFPRHGVRRYVSIERRVRRALKGVDAAVRTGGVFHLWFHPTNLADDLDGMLGGLRSIFRSVRDHRRSGRLSTETMSMAAGRA